MLAGACTCTCTLYTRTWDCTHSRSHALELTSNCVLLASCPWEIVNLFVSGTVHVNHNRQVIKVNVLEAAWVFSSCACTVRVDSRFLIWVWDGRTANSVLFTAHSTQLLSDLVEQLGLPTRAHKEERPFVAAEVMSLSVAVGVVSPPVVAWEFYLHTRLHEVRGNSLVCEQHLCFSTTPLHLSFSF